MKGGIDNIIICGAGPSGLILGLLLAKAGIRVQILDAASSVNTNPRASHYGPPAVYELQRAGVIEEVAAQGFRPDGVSWRRLDGSCITKIDTKDVPVEKKIVCLPLDQLMKILLRHIEAQPSAEVLWSHKVVGLRDGEERATVEVETPEGARTLEATYVVGCDGATSTIRRQLFGDAFPGRTWDEQIVATNTYYDMSPYNWQDSNFIVHPEHCYMVAKIQNDGLLRITYLEKAGLSREEYLERQPEKFKTFLPGHPDPDKYKIVNFSPYKIHQRCAEKFRVGRFLLAADAAHLCNPFGGLGLTGGMVDVGNLYDCLYGIHSGQADDSILDKYDEIRRQKYRDFIDPISSDNLRRLLYTSEEQIEKDEFYNLVKRAEVDEEFSKTLQLGIDIIREDFTQYYKKPTVEAAAKDIPTSLPAPTAVVSGEA